MEPGFQVFVLDSEVAGLALIPPVLVYLIHELLFLEVELLEVDFVLPQLLLLFLDQALLLCGLLALIVQLFI